MEIHNHPEKSFKMVHYADVIGKEVNSTITLSALMFDKEDIPVEYHYVVLAWYDKEATSGLTSDKMNTLLSSLKAYLKSQNVSDEAYNGDVDSTIAQTLKDIAFRVAYNIDFDNETNPSSNNDDNENHLLVIAWYGKTTTSGLDSEVIARFKLKLDAYLKDQGYSDEEIKSVILREYDGAVAPSCAGIKNDGDVDY